MSRLTFLGLLLIGSFPTQPPLSGADMPVKASVCQILATPGKYQGKIVQVNAEALTGRHGAGLVDEACPGSILLWAADLGAADSARWQGEVACRSVSPRQSQAPEEMQWRPLTGPPQPVTLERTAASEEFLRALGSAHEEDRLCMRNKLKATIVGRFDYEPCKSILVRSDPGSQPRSYAGGFGAMNGSPMRLVVQSINEVVLGTENPCWREAEKRSKPQEPR